MRRRWRKKETKERQRSEQRINIEKCYRCVVESLRALIEGAREQY